MPEQETDPTRDPIGRTSSPFRAPNTTLEFSFWLRPGARLNPFDFVVAEHSFDSRTVGIVTEMENVTDADSHLTNFIGSEFGDPNAESYVERVSALAAKAKVLRNIPAGEGEELYTPLGSDRRVHFAGAHDIAQALGFDLIRGTSLPAGMIRQSNGVHIPVYLDSQYVLGPEGAHVNCSGISGLATKTSFLMFLLTSIYQQMGDRTAFVIFNVKHSDLLHLHEPADDLSNLDRSLLTDLGLNIEPFGDVRYYLPRGQDGHPASDDPPQNHETYAYTLEDVHRRLDILFAEVQDPYYTLDAFVQYVRTRWSQGRIRFDPQGARLGQQVLQPFNVQTWAAIHQAPDAVLGAAVYNNPRHVTPPHIKRELSRLTGFSMFVQNRGANEVYLGDVIPQRLTAGSVTVIDIYQVPSRNQTFVVGDVMRSIEQAYRQTQLADMPNLVILIDELNTFAPAAAWGAGPTPITEEIIEIARKGRSRRTALFGAQQFKSDVHPQVWGNATINAIGRTGSAELSTTPYREFDRASKQFILNLLPGELILDSKTWRTPVKVVFPKPPYRRPAASS